jgi:hypothetical protein
MCGAQLCTPFDTASKVIPLPCSCTAGLLV